MFLSTEIDASPELKGFIEHRGAPAALALENGIFSTTKIFLYYPENSELYLLEAGEDSSWLIHGPDPIPQEAANLLQGAVGNSAALKGIQRPLPSASSFNPGTSGESQQESSRFESFRSPSQKSATKEPPHDDFESRQLAKIASQIDSSEGERTPKGDYVHYVTYEGETLSLLARWYTFDATNSARIARMNQLKNPDLLTLGDTIIIPSYLLKNNKRLNEAALEALRPFSLGLDS
jgi:hypothetical protein